MRNRQIDESRAVSTYRINDTEITINKRQWSQGGLIESFANKAIGKVAKFIGQ